MGNVQSRFWQTPLNALLDTPLSRASAVLCVWCENWGERLRIVSEFGLAMAERESPTLRASPTFCLRTVRGVLPRSFPGVLNTSITFLFIQSAPNASSMGESNCLQSLLGENVGHMFVQPLHLIANRETKILHFLGDEVVCLMALIKNPLGGPDGRRLCACGHGDGERGCRGETGRPARVVGGVRMLEKEKMAGKMLF